MTITYKDVIMGNDCGNGFSKACVQFADGAEYVIDMPSAALRPKDDAIVIENTADAPNAVANAVADLENQLDVSVKSDAIKNEHVDGGRMFVGEHALKGRGTKRTFNISNTKSKSQEALSYRLTLTTVAAAALKHAFEQKGELPDSIEVHVTAAVNLPIDDFNRNKDDYERELVEGKHQVRFENLKGWPTVDVVFDAVDVLPEGVAASAALSVKSPEFMDAMLELNRQLDYVDLTGVTGESLLAAKDYVGLDIGEGTCDVVSFLDGSWAAATSSSIPVGYGSALEEASKTIRTRNSAIKSRRELADFLLTPEAKRDYIWEQMYAKLEDDVMREEDECIETIVREFSDTLSNIAVPARCVFVYGGGAMPLADRLVPALSDQTEAVFSVRVPVVLIGGEGKDLNRQGLFMRAEYLHAMNEEAAEAEKKAAKASKKKAAR